MRMVWVFAVDPKSSLTRVSVLTRSCAGARLDQDDRAHRLAGDTRGGLERLPLLQDCPLQPGLHEGEPSKLVHRLQSVSILPNRTSQAVGCTIEIDPQLLSEVMLHH